MDYDSVFQLLGIKLELFKAHSTRHDASSATYLSHIPVGDIQKKARWNNAKTFEQFFYKHVST